MKLQSLQLKIALWAGGCLIVTAGIIILFSALSMRDEALQAREKALQQAKQIAGEVAGQHAQHVKALLEVPLDAARTLAQTLSGIHKTDVGLELDREEVNGILRTVLEENPDFLGIGTCWEPNAFDNMDRGYRNAEGHDETGRFISYWNRGGEQGGIVLEAFVDYEVEGIGDWYVIPKRSKEEILTEPSVHTVQGVPSLGALLAAPVVVDDTFYGVVAIDLLLGVLQVLVDKTEYLYEGTAQIVIFSHDGSVAAMTGAPDMIDTHIKDVHPHDWEEDLEAIRNGEPNIEIDAGRLAVFAPFTAGRTTTPWAVNVLIPMEKVTAAADAQLRHTFANIWKMVGLALSALVAACVTLWFVTRRITRPIGQLVEVADALSEGDFSRSLHIRQDDEIGKLATAFQSMQNTITGVMQEVGHLLTQIQRGHLDARGNPDQFTGNWQELVSGMNSVMDAFATPFNVTAEYLDRISKGELPPKITDQYEGDFIEVINNVNQCIDAIGGLVAESAMLTEVAVQGRFDIRGNADSFSGNYAAIVEGINNTIATLVGHIDQIPIPIMIIDGDFTIQYLNRAAATTFGQSQTEAIGQHCYNCQQAADCQTDQCVSARAMQSGQTETGETTTTLAGKEAIIAYHGVPIKDPFGNVIGALEISMDQTEIKQALTAVEQQNWLRTGQAELNNVMRGEQDVATLAKNIIAYLANYLNADIGTLYLAQGMNGNARLKLVGSHAYTRRNASDNTIKIGDGLAGQAAAEQETVLYSDIPDDYLPIATEFGHEAPKHLLVSPFLYQGELKGVIEVGTTGEFSDEHIEFLKQASENIAVTVHSAQTRQKMEVLVEKRMKS